MSWAGLADNQCISCTNLQNAIDTGVFTAGTTAIPSTDPAKYRQVVKVSASVYITVPNPDYPPYAVKTNNQLIVKSDIYNPGDFILDPQYGKQFDSMTGTGLPSFTYPVTGANTTKQYNGIITAQNIGLTISGTAFVTPVYVALYVNSQIVSTAALSNAGSNSVTLNLPNDVISPTTIRIAINSGTAPSPSAAITFGSTPVNNVAVSKTTGQYQIASIGTYDFATAGFYRFADTSGYLCYSSDYGATWYKSNTIGTFSRLAISDDGQYALATSQNGYVYRSTNYGATWSTISTTLSTRVWSGAAVATDGATMYVCSRNASPYTQGYVFKSTDYGATWSDVTPASSKDFNGIDVAGAVTPTNVIVGLYNNGSSTPAYYLSINGASSWNSYNVF